MNISTQPALASTGTSQTGGHGTVSSSQPVTATEHAGLAQRSGLYIEGDDRFIVFVTTDNVLYRLPVVILRNISSAVDGVFSIPASDDKEGSDDEHAVQLHVSSEQYRPVHELILGPTVPDRTFSGLELFHVIVLAHRWGMPWMHCLTLMFIRDLDGDLDLPSHLRLILAVRYRVETLLEPAFRELVRMDMQLITNEVCDALGMPIVRIIFALKIDLARLPRKLAAEMPTFQYDPRCRNNDKGHTCLEGWRRNWFYRVVPQLVNHEHPLPGPVEPDALTRLVGKLEGVCDLCHRNTIDVFGFLEDTEVFDSEEELYKAALRELRGLGTYF
ncbi:unnamed protein product [Peniophora sp. CBMAI 1063]|nr:unnamed protein product [Peniophora sp. CBMAI 1063]